MNNQLEFTTSPFDAIRKTDEQGNEYWSARELGRVLGYQANYRNFQKAIAKAQKACEESGYAASDHFAQTRTMVPPRFRGQTTGRGYSLVALWGISDCPKCRS